MDDKLADIDEPVTSPPLRPPLFDTSSPSLDDPLPGSVSLDALRAWYEQRAEQRLRGEWESAVRRLVDLLDESRGTPLTLAALRITAPHTRQSFLASLLSPYLNQPSSLPSTVATVLRQTRDITQVLALTSLFTSLQPSLVRSLSPLAQPGDVELQILAKERPRVFLKGGTDLGNGEASASITARLSNIFGGAEALSFVLSTGTRTRRAYELALEAPLPGLARILPGTRAGGEGKPGWELGTRGEVSLWGNERDWSTWASCWEGQTGGRLGIRTRSLYGSHTLTYDLVSRSIHSLSPTASLSTRLAAGPSTKSSISHTLSRTWPSASVRLMQELAGLGGDARFLKFEADGNKSFRMTKNITTTFSTRTAFLQPMFGTPTLLSDRVFIGGPTSVRMFRQNTMGPHDGPDAVGGEIAISAGASILGSFPGIAAAWPLSWHIWANTGALGRLHPGQSPITAMRDTLARPSVTAGVGLVMKIDLVRVEANVGVPLVTSKGEGFRRGLQAGVGIEFL